MNTLIINTPRLTIRLFQPEDAKGYYQLLAHPAVHCFEDEKPNSLQRVEKEIEKISKNNDGSYLAVCLKDSGEFAGSLFGMWEGDTFSACWNFLPRYTGQGLAFEARRAYFDFLFGHMNARRIYAYVEDYNTPSQRLCERLGMRKEGLFKEFISFVNDGKGNPIYENTMQFAILKKEWEDMQK